MSTTGWCSTTLSFSGAARRRASRLPTSFELLPGEMDATWTGPTRTISLPAELAGLAVDKLPALENELRVDPPPLEHPWQPSYGYLLADDHVLWAACADIPAVDAYSMDSGEFLRRVHVPTPLDQHRELRTDPEHEAVMAFGDQIFVLSSGEQLASPRRGPKECDTGISLHSRCDFVMDTSQMMLEIAGTSIELTSPEPIPMGSSSYFRVDAFWFEGRIVTIVGD